MSGPHNVGGEQSNQPPSPAPPAANRQHGGPTGPADAERRRRRVIAGGIVGGAIVLAIIGLGIANLTGAFDDPTPAGPDRTKPESVASVFVQRYAAHDPAVCELVTAEQRTRFERAGRCGGQRSATTPKVDVLVSRTCGTRHGFSAEVNPPGEIGKRYVSVGLEMAGTEWSVRSVLPLSDRAVIRDYDCAPPATAYGS